MHNLIASLMVVAAATAPTTPNGDSIIGRPYKSFETTAYCQYEGFHPTHYMTDNNWDILCAFRHPGSKARLDSLDIPASDSQLRLLEVGGLLKRNNSTYTTAMHIFDKAETESIRREAREFTDSLFPIIRPYLEKLSHEFDSAGFTAQKYSLLFSYLLDGYIWQSGYLPQSEEMTNHGTWSGAFWAMYAPARDYQTGTNTYGGSVVVNWNDNLNYMPATFTLFRFANEARKSGGRKVEDAELVANLAKWGLTDQAGNITIPVIRKNDGGTVDILSREICTRLSEAVKANSGDFMKRHHFTDEKEAEVIFYHEALWMLLDECERQGIVQLPEILKKDGNASATDFAQISFIVLDE